MGGGCDHFLGEPGSGLANPRELAASAAGNGEVLERQVADHLADLLVPMVDEGVVAADVCLSDPGAPLSPPRPALRDPLSVLLSREKRRRLGGGPEPPHADATHADVR